MSERPTWFCMPMTSLPGSSSVEDYSPRTGTTPLVFQAVRTARVYHKEVKMTTPLSLLITLSMVLLSLGEQPTVGDVIKPRKVQLLGGWHERSPDSAEVKDAIQYAVKMYNSHSKSKRLFRLDSITTVQSQVTNVINFKIDTVLGKTKCSKAENHDLEHCELEKKRMGCQFVVSFNPVSKKHELKERTCKKLVKPKA